MTERELNALPSEISTRLRYLDRKVRGLAAMRGMGLSCVVLCGGVAAGLLFDWLFDLGAGPRSAVLIGVLGATLLAVATAIIRPLIRKSSAAELAALVDTSFPDLGERIESTVELSDPDLPESHKGSEFMRSQLMRETVRKSEGVDFGAAADSSSAFRWVFVAVLALLLIVVPFGLSKDGYALMLSRFLTPWRNLERASNLYFEVENPDRTVARGDDVTITATPKWRLTPGDLPDNAWLTWQNTDGETDERRMDWSASSEAYVATLPHVFTSFDYEVSAGPARTRSYHINVVERPDVTEFQLEIVPPAYTGRAVRTLDGAIGRTEVFERSELTFELAFNKPVESAEFVWLSDATGDVAASSLAVDDDSDATAIEAGDPDRVHLEMSEDHTRGRVSFEALRSGPYAVILIDRHELQSSTEVSRELIVMPDMPPQVAWDDLDPSQVVNIPPIEARPDAELALSVTATDDVGVDELALHIEVIQRSENLGPLEADSPRLGQPELPHTFTVTLGDYELQEGDLLSVRARAIDGRPVPNPQEGWSAARLIRITKDADPVGLQALMQEQQKLRSAIEKIRQDVQQDRDEARDLEKEAAQKQKEKQPFDRKEELAELAQRERDVQQKLEQLAAVFEDHPLQTNIADETRKIADEPIEQAKERLQEAEAAPVHQQRDRLRKAASELSKADKQLEKLLQQFDELAALERDLQQLQQLAEDAEQLADNVEQFERDWEELERLDQEQKLPEQQQQAQEDQLAERQMDLQDEQKDLASALDHLFEERPEILEAARQHQLDQLKQLAEEAQKLAKHQDRLAHAMRREPKELAQKRREEEAAAKPQAENQAKTEPSQAGQPDEGAPTPSEDKPDSPAEGQKSEQPSPNEPMVDEPMPGQPQGAKPPADDQDGEDAQSSPAQRQQQLADDAARQALETARQQGIDSEAAKEARRFAEQARKAAEEAERGLLADAANTAKQSAQSAEKTSQQMQQAAEPLPARMTEQADALAQQQAETAEQLREASQSTEQRQAAERQGQQQVAEETAQLTQQLAEVAERLASEPLNEQQAGQRAESAEQSAQQAEQSQEQAESQIEQQGLREASDPAREAAKALFEAAKNAREAERQLGHPEESPVPGEVGEQVADARRQLEQAGEQLQQPGPQQQEQPPGEPQEGQPGEPSEGEPGQQPGEQPGEGEGMPPGEDGQPSEEGQPSESGEGDQPGQKGQPGEGDGKPSGESSQPGKEGQPSGQPGKSAGSESMRQVAKSLQQAAQQMGLQPSQRSQNQGQDEQSGDSQEGADGPQGGYGARGGLSLADLEAELGRISDRNWGQLPDRVESELQQAQRKKPDRDYARLIRLYFAEVARRRSAADGLEAGGGEEAE